MSLKNPVTQPGIDPGTVRLVAQRLNHYATPGPSSYIIRAIKIKEQETVKHTATVETRYRCTVCEEKVHFVEMGVNGRTVSNILYK
jgi:hypothetical protein